MKRTLFCLIIISALSCSVQNKARKQALAMTRAITSNNYEETLKYTHPNVIKMIGGNQKFIEILKIGTNEMQNMGNKYESIEIGKPSQTVKAGNEIHCLIPETIKMQLKDGKMISKSYLLAVTKDKGKNWTFIETALLTNSNIISILPTYNKSLVIPEKEVPQYFK